MFRMYKTQRRATFIPERKGSSLLRYEIKYRNWEKIFKMEGAVSVKDCCERVDDILEKSKLNQCN